MTFKAIRRRALESWEEFDSDDGRRILVGAGTCGRAAGGTGVLSAAREWAAGNGADPSVTEVGCLGLCYAEPLVELRAPGKPRTLFGDVTAENLPGLLEGFFSDGSVPAERALAAMGRASLDGVPAFHDLPMLRGQRRIVLRNCGRIDPDNIEHYLALDGYCGLAKALEMPPEQVIEQVKASGLRGRGGAGFPTGLKWGFCREAPGEEKYVICNADEGDPGAFMDRSVLESDPHSVIEGLTIAAYACGASEGYVYVRAEYPLAVQRLHTAIEQAEERGLLGENVLDSDFSFHLRIKEGAGAFVCGEETALLASIEGERGMPRSRPPFPAQQGLHGKPTNINNVETLANVPVIMNRGADWFAEVGTEESPGTKTFALAGQIERTGLVEVPLGTPLEDIVLQVGGGVPDGKRVKAVQTGGPSGGCIPARLLHLPVEYETLAEVGSIMGSGGMIVMDEDSCMVDVARYFIQFTHDESCGKCSPCRLGTRQMLNLLDKIADGRGEPQDLGTLERVAHAVKVTSLCGLGQTAPNPVLTTLDYFQDECQAHITEGRCPAGVCTALVSFHIDPEVCICCGRCADECPVDCISGTRGKPPARATDEDRERGRAGEPFVIDQDVCIKCGACKEACPVGAVAGR
ncbi:MAG: NADH-quinone oxidoreductase subunit NuoF [Planctomycetota bacterium]